MHGTTRLRAAGPRVSNGIHAVVWIEPGRALVVRGGAGEEHVTTELPLPREWAATPPALAEVAHSIGDVDRVLVLGNDELRIALEREIVAIGHRPETIREAVGEGPVDEAVLLARLSRLT